MADFDASDARTPRPFLRWAGGKRWLSRSVKDALPRSFNRYFEPFLGSGAVFFRVHPPTAHLSDSNQRLVEAFQMVRDFPSQVSDALESYAYTKAEYYVVRSSNPASSVERAAQFLYLNRTCWNGLYRVNQQGAFNVPYGRRGDFREEDRKMLVRSSRALQGVVLRAEDFGSALRRVKSGDLVFLDPPYTVTHGNNGFLLYNERIFSWADQERLARAVKALDKRGAHFLLTNANHPSVIELYRDFDSLHLFRSSVLAADLERRRAVSELLISNYKIGPDKFQSQRES